MAHNNIEIKAKHDNIKHVRYLLKQNKAKFIGKDHQIDTYFKVPSGRLKIREGNIEHSLIYYEREDIKGPKHSKVTLVDLEPKSNLKDLFMKIFRPLVVVDKKREIYFIDNVKFHIDSVNELGEFIEIEAIDKEGKIGLETLTNQCKQYIDLFEIKNKNLIDKSYSDLLLENNSYKK
ncbi:class IV adenylate cyclase [Candidatus Woesearchaeota archaeon]|nr:class IV adenylate cyclase [Candidatus Woesearchaeota archaeon]